MTVTVSVTVKLKFTLLRVIKITSCYNITLDRYNSLFFLHSYWLGHAYLDN